MIRRCTCTGRSASTIGLSKRLTASCKTCGGKPLVNGKGSPTSSMLTTVGLECANLIDSDLTWKKVSKGNRSSSRRARKLVEKSLKASGELVNKDSKEVEMPVSESEKLGVTVLGCRFSEKAEYVPIKKRRFLFRSPSPPPRTPSPCFSETERLVKSRHASGLGFHPSPTKICQPLASDSPVDLGHIFDSDFIVDGKKLVKVNNHINDYEDFSGISILAAAACSNSLEGDADYIEGGSGVKSSGREGHIEILMNNESNEDLVNSAEISTEGTGSCISTALPVGPASSKMDNTSPNGLPPEKMSESVSLLGDSAAGSQSLLSKKAEGLITMQETSARDDRLHWDLNTVMDAWEHPFDCQPASSPTNVVDYIPARVEDGKTSDKKGKLEGCDLQSLQGTSDDIGKALLPGESRSLDHEALEWKMEESKLNTCTLMDRSICSEAKLLSSESDDALDVVVDMVRETEPLHNEERFSQDAGSLASVPHKNAPGYPLSAIIDESAPSDSVNLRTGNGESLSSDLVGGMDSSVDGLLPPESNHLTNTSLSEENCDAASTGVVHADNADDGNVVVACGGDAKKIYGFHNDGNALENMVAIGTGHPLGNEPLGDDVKENAILRSDEGGFSQSNHNHVKEMTTSGACVEDKPVLAVGEKVQHSEVSSGHDTTKTGTQVHDNAGELPSTVSAGKSVTLVSSHDAHKSYSDDLVNSSCNVTLGEPLDDGSQCHPCLGVGIEKENQLPVDYDSQYEDGELRESSIHMWEEYDVEYGETEHLDYDSDNIDTTNLGSENAKESNIQSSPEGSHRMKIADGGSGGGSAVKTSTQCSRVQMAEKVGSGGKGSCSEPDVMIRGNENHDRRDNVKESSQSDGLKMKMSGWDQLPENRRSCSDAVTRVREGSIRKIFSGDQKDGLEAEDKEKMVDGSRVYRRELLSRIEGPASRGMLLRRERLHTQGGSDVDDLNPRFERDLGTFKSSVRGRYSLHIHARRRGSDHWADSPEGDKGLKPHLSPTFHGITASHRSGPEDVASDGNATKGGSVGSGAERQMNTASSDVMHRSLRSGSPTDRQESYRLGFRPAREVSPDRFLTVGRDRSVRYGPRVDTGGPRRRYHGGVNDDCIGSSLDYSHPLSRRCRSFLPIERREISHTRRSNSKSPSRSRTRSPIAWQSPRGRNGDGLAANLGFRHRSRSPNYRSDARIPRVRSPHLRPGFVADHVVGFVSVPRSHGSPPPNSRWVGYKQRSSVLDRRSPGPGRLGPRGDRFGFLDSPRKPKPKEYYGSVHPGRFSELNGVGRGGPSYEGNDDDRRKHGNRYGLAHPVRRYDMDGAVKRFRYDVEDGFASAHDSRDKDSVDLHGRGNPKAYERGNRIGDLPRRSREEKAPFIYRRDGKYNANSKSFRMREGDEDEAPRRRRPS